jgi:dihydropteroate synthase
MILEARGHQITFPRRPLVMAIININDDSFCGDGTLDIRAALDQAARALAEGADVIDIGAESARTNRGPITVDDEVSRLIPFIDAWPKLIEQNEAAARGSEQLWPPLLSINTWRSEVVSRVLPVGGDLLNDISALPDSKNAALCAEHGAALLIMHTVGQPKVAHTHVSYPDIMDTLVRFFDEKIELALSAGLQMNQIILDPGIDFAKQKEDNLTLYRELDRLQKWDRPILLPVSRKTVIGDVLDLKNPTERDAGTVACIASGMSRGAHLFRVHHVRAAVQTVKTLWALTSD